MQDELNLSHFLINVVIKSYGPYKVVKVNFTSFSFLLTSILLYLLKNSIINILFSSSAKCLPIQFLAPALNGISAYAFW